LVNNRRKIDVVGGKKDTTFKPHLRIGHERSSVKERWRANVNKARTQSPTGRKFGRDLVKLPLKRKSSLSREKMMTKKGFLCNLSKN